MTNTADSALIQSTAAEEPTAATTKTSKMILSDHIATRYKMKSARNTEIDIISFNFAYQMEFKKTNWGGYHNNGLGINLETDSQYHLRQQLFIQELKKLTEKPSFLCLQEMVKTEANYNFLETEICEGTAYKVITNKYRPKAGETVNNKIPADLTTVYDASVYDFDADKSDKLQNASKLQQALYNRTLISVFKNKETNEEHVIVNIHASFGEEITLDIDNLYNTIRLEGYQNISIIGDFNRRLSGSKNYGEDTAVKIKDSKGQIHEDTSKSDLADCISGHTYTPSLSATVLNAYGGAGSFCFKHQNIIREDRDGLLTTCEVTEKAPVWELFQTDVSNIDSILNKTQDDNKKTSFQFSNAFTRGIATLINCGQTGLDKLTPEAWLGFAAWLGTQQTPEEAINPQLHTDREVTAHQKTQTLGNFIDETMRSNATPLSKTNCPNLAKNLTPVPTEDEKSALTYSQRVTHILYKLHECLHDLRNDIQDIYESRDFRKALNMKFRSAIEYLTLGTGLRTLQKFPDENTEVLFQTLAHNLFTDISKKLCDLPATDDLKALAAESKNPKPPLLAHKGTALLGQVRSEICEFFDNLKSPTKEAAARLTKNGALFAASDNVILTADTATNPPAAAGRTTATAPGASPTG